MNRVVHFEFNVPDPRVAEQFYARVFGWMITAWSGSAEYLLVTTGEDTEIGIDGAIMQSRDGQPRTVNTIEVASVDDVAVQIVEHGGQVVVPRMSVPGVGYLAYCTDPGGLLFGIIQTDESAP